LPWKTLFPLMMTMEEKKGKETNGCTRMAAMDE
jgi:hypothetical protein